ncbi:MAG: DUF2799 domain-containing protein [Alphaproteobacteria bacterium]|nr:DUF2799 domain-containing protein [Alphaproteobacteria bacterium]
MLRFVLAVAGLMLVVVLSGCATLSKVECQTGDWRGIGLSDGSHGYSSSRIEQHAEACAQHGVAPSRELYMAGYEQGLVSYCRLDRAAETGTSGGAYYQVCTGEIGLSFGRVYIAARDVYLARSEADGIRTEIDAVTDKLTQPGLTDEVRLVLGGQLSSLQDSLERQQDAVSREERRLRTVMADEVRRLNVLGITA